MDGFKPQVERFNRGQFTVVAWDPPGYGKSRPPLRDFPADFYEKDAHYAYEFMKALKIPKYSLLGWSDGGIASMIHAAKYPSAVHKLVVWGTKSLILPEELKIYEKGKHNIHLRYAEDINQRVQEFLLQTQNSSP